jgi:diguanylate cyclase (GGDEF)-like protein
MFSAEPKTCKIKGVKSSKEPKPYAHHFHSLFQNTAVSLNRKKIIRRFSLTAFDLKGVYHEQMKTVLLLETLVSAFALITMIIYLILGIVQYHTTLEKGGWMLYAADGTMAAASFLFLNYVLFGKGDDPKNDGLSRVFSVLLILGIFTGVMFFFSYDAIEGYLTGEYALLSASMLWIIGLALCPLVYSLDFWIIDSVIFLTIVVTSLFYGYAYQMNGTLQYILIGFGYLATSFIFRNILFSFECQKRYIETRNVALFQTSLVDDLTGCHNRKGLDSYLAYQVPGWRKRKTEVTMLLFSIDGFEDYEETFSPLKADECMKKMMEAIGNSFELPPVAFFRFDANHFLLFFENLSESDVAIAAERIRKAAEDAKVPAPHSSASPVMTISVGMVRVIADNRYSFIRQYNLALNELTNARKMGNNCVSYSGRILSQEA